MPPRFGRPVPRPICNEQRCATMACAWPAHDRCMIPNAGGAGRGMSNGNEICFDDCTLRRDSGDLIRDGRTLRLRAQVQQVLEALLERPGEVVTRAQLIARLWPKGIVDFEIALNSAVRRLRAALEDDAETPRYVETLPRRGYRFIGTLHVET